jgi:uncharacterized protein (DUF58 family)
LPELGLRPLAWARAQVSGRIRAWWIARLPRNDTLLLTQRNVYILPTPAGFVFAATLLVLLVASINYQLNLGYLLTFILAGSGVVSMHLTHGTLRGLTLHVHPVAAVHAGEAAELDVVLTSPGTARWGIGMRVESAPASTLTWTDVPAGGQAPMRVSFVPQRRGRQELPTLIAETRFPLGLFRTWTVWRPASQLLVYPALERPASPLPAAAPAAGTAAQARRAEGADFEGVRGYRRGDAQKLIVWKKAARALDTGGELVSRDSSSTAHWQLWLDWQQCAGLADELRLSRLAAWVVVAHRSGADYGLRLPGVELPRGQGDAHRRACLEALALWRSESSNGPDAELRQGQI